MLNKYLQIGVQRLREFTKPTHKFPSTTACEELCNIVEYERWNKGDGS